MKSESEESTEKLLESLHAPRIKPEMAKEKNPKKIPVPPDREHQEEKQKTRKEHAAEFIKKNARGIKEGISILTAFKAILNSGKLFFVSLGVILAMLLLSIFLYHQVLYPIFWV